LRKLLWIHVDTSTLIGVNPRQVTKVRWIIFDYLNESVC
jgi:hypothetical protein